MSASECCDGCRFWTPGEYDLPVDVPGQPRVMLQTGRCDHPETVARHPDPESKWRERAGFLGCWRWKPARRRGAA